VTTEERRTASLLLAPGGAGAVEAPGPALRRAARTRGVPPAPVRLAEALAMKRGLLSLGRNVIRPVAAARVEALGERAAAEPPRLLIRMDEFPHAQVWDRPERYGNDAFRRFHRILADAGVPYLLAVMPRPCHDYLDPAARGDRALTDEERELLGQACAEGAEPATHGLTHRTRDATPRRHSELSGLSSDELRGLIERSDEELALAGIRPRVFVPPFNRFDAAQLPILGSRFEVICGGPESVPLLGFARGPAWRGETVYFPSYPPLYERAGPIAAALAGLAARSAGAWLQVTLHLGWEADQGFTALERLAEAVAPHARPWSDFLAAVESSRAA
jgi:peptidoglycan/xylan/chitin deacetylase (PgdA/CDA1 family)